MIVMLSNILIYSYINNLFYFSKAMKEAEDRSTKRLVDKIIQLDNEQTIVLRVDMFESSDSFVHFLNTMSTYVSPDGVSKAQKTTKLILAKIVPISNYVH